VLPEQRRSARIVPLPEWYWESVEADVRGTPKVVDLPVAESSVVRIEGATRVWDELGVEGRDRLQRDGLVVLGSADAPGPPAPVRLHMGAFYTEQRQQRVPYVVTLDALAYAMHLAFERALAEVDDAVIAPELDSLLTKLDARLTVEQKGAGVEVGEALQLAQAIVAVARGLANVHAHDVRVRDHCDLLTHGLEHCGQRPRLSRLFDQPQDAVDAPVIVLMDLHANACVWIGVDHGT